MRYAIAKLGFKEEDIVLFAWSIGGYTASYAAMMYPNIKALVCNYQPCPPPIMCSDNIIRIRLISIHYKALCTRVITSPAHVKEESTEVCCAGKRFSEKSIPKTILILSVEIRLKSTYLYHTC